MNDLRSSSADQSVVGDVPVTMRAVFVRELGGTDVMEFGELPTPTPGPTDVLVRFEASEVNQVDTYVRSGRYPTHTPFPFVVGRDIVGRVAVTGSGVGKFAVGDRVWCNSLGHAGRQGSFSDYALVPVDRLYPLPDGVTAEDAAPVLHAAATAHIALFREARLQPGETVFIAGGAGSVGAAAVQLAHWAGAWVIATAGPDDLERCRANGADTVFDYHDPHLADRLRATAPSGIGVWWDTSGHHDLAGTLELLRIGGRILVTAGMAETPQLPIGALYTRDVSIRGFVISNADVDDLARAAEAINHLLARGRLRGRVAKVFSLGQAASAHRVMQDGGVRGRVLVVA